MSSVARLKSILSHFCFYGIKINGRLKNGLESRIGTSQSVLSKNCLQKTNFILFFKKSICQSDFSLIDRLDNILDNILDNLLDNDIEKYTYLR